MRTKNEESTEQGKDPQHSLHEENNSLGFIEAVFQW